MSESKSAVVTELIQIARAGDVNALGRLLERHENYLNLLARIQIGRYLQSKVDPADVVQEVFLDAVRQFPHFVGDDPESFAAWLRRILAGKLAHLIRRYCAVQARNVRLERSIEADLDSSSNQMERSLIGNATSPSEVAARRENLIRLGDALEQLSPDYREVILLRQIEGVPFIEIARRLQRTEDSVQKLWVRGLDALRRVLENDPS